MHFFTEDKAPIRYECFGWWLSDLVDILKVERIPKPDVSTDVTCGHESRLDSEGSDTSRHQQKKTDVGQITFDLTDPTTINRNIAKDRNIPHQIEYKAPLSSLTADTARTRTPSSKITVQYENTLENSSCPKQQLVASMNLHLPNHKRLQKLLDQGSQSTAIPTQSRQALKISTALNKSKQSVADPKTRLQNDWTSQVEDDDTGLSPFVKLALSIEHDPNRKLDESRCALLQAFRDLDSRVRGLQEGVRQMQADINRLQQDFQVCGSLNIIHIYIYIYIYIWDWTAQSV